MYLKDEASLNAYLIANAVEGAEFAYSADAPPLREAALERLLHDYTAATDQINRLSQRADPAILTAMLEMTPPSAELWQEPEAGARWVEALAARVNRAGLGRPGYQLRVRATDAEHLAALIIERTHHGISTSQVLPAAFFAGAEFKPIRDVAEQLAGLIQDGAQIRRGNNSTAVADFARVRTWLLEEAKKGRTIQRFKGLGEMNPEQLWETTMDPAVRRLLKVQIEDAITSDDIFATLMGEQVEPRRDFIESNALGVRNLDV
jgi:DNA gyrase subunit B